MRSHRPAVLAVLVVATLLAGCSDDDPGPAGASPSSSGSASSSGSPSVSSSTSASAGASPTSTPSAAGPTSYVESLIFMMPSGNLGCFMYRSTAAKATVSCQGSWDFTPPPPPPGGCGGVGDWAGVLDLDDAPHFECASDTFLGDHPTLDYGRSLRVANIVCTSERTGVTCRNVTNGRGFKVSRSRYTFSPPPAAAEADLADSSVYVQTAAFATPSRNIGCVLTHFADDGHALVSCVIREFSYAPPPRPAECPAPDSWGNELIMGNVTYFQCAGGTDVRTAAYPVLPYGGRVTLDSVTCTSETTGIVCADSANGRRIALSRERYSLS